MTTYSLWAGSSNSDPRGCEGPGLLYSKYADGDDAVAADPVGGAQGYG